VTLTVTDNTAATDSVSHSVAPVSGGGSTPVAAFTSTCTSLSCAFDGSTSSDTGGTITGYSWDFGDGSAAATGANPTHVYAVAGTYTVTLTVTDSTSATNSVSHSVAPVAGSGTPVAAFTSTCTNLSCAFDGSTSSDTGGTITGYSWNFGDGSTAEGLAALYAYESQIPAISESKIDGLVRHYQFTNPESYRYFTVHIEADREHAAAERALLAVNLAPENSGAVSAAAERVLSALWELLSAVCRRHAIA
jgi:PKD repeat protein